MKLEDRLRFKVDEWKRRTGLDYKSFAYVSGFQQSLLSRYMNHDLIPPKKRRAEIAKILLTTTAYLWGKKYA